MSLISQTSAPAKSSARTPRGNRMSLLLCLLWVTCSVGCSPWQLARRTLFRELNAYPRVTDGRLACAQYKLWAKKEWTEIVAETGETYSNDYASGFLQGFVDQVDAGGKIQPPPMPPRRYWRLQYRNKHGRRAIENYYNGFEHGARVAYDNGYRERATIPSSLYMADAAAAPGTMTQESVDGALEVPTPNELIPPEASSVEPSNSPTTPSGEQEEASPSEGQIPDPAPLPLPLEETTTRPQVPRTSLSAAHQNGNGYIPPAPASNRHITADKLPDATVNELPPEPPWRRSTSSSAVVIPTLHEVPRRFTEQAPSGKIDEFDPFAGTQFSHLAETTVAPEHDTETRVKRQHRQPTDLQQTRLSDSVLPSVLPPLDLKPSDFIGNEASPMLAAPSPPVVTVSARARSTEPPLIPPLSNISSLPTKPGLMTKTSENEVTTGWQAVDVDNLKSEWKSVP